MNHAPMPAPLGAIAHRGMLERGCSRNSRGAKAELAAITRPASPSGPDVRDLRELLWCSIDNDDSRDLDQLSVAVAPTAASRILVAIADVDALVAKGSAIDDHAATNTTSVYTAAGIFPMLPEKLSTNLTSLGEGDDRLALVVDMAVDAAGRGCVESTCIAPSCATTPSSRTTPSPRGSTAHGAGAGAPGGGHGPRCANADPGRRGAALKRSRHERGALTLETLEVRPCSMATRRRRTCDPNEEPSEGADREFHDRGQRRHCDVSRPRQTFRRCVACSIRRSAGRASSSWPRRPATSCRHRPTPPRSSIPAAKPQTRSRAFRRRLALRRQAARFRRVRRRKSGAAAEGHFGLAVNDYAHSTAPNRRFPDLVTQRLVKAALAGRSPPYSPSELAALALHCTKQEDNATKVERQVRKSAAALLLAPRIGKRFDGIVTGASAKGTWVRISSPTVEGRVVRGFEGLDVGDKVRVELLRADATHGFIDFARAGAMRMTKPAHRCKAACERARGQPSVTRTRCVAPSSASRTRAGVPAQGVAPSSETRVTPRRRPAIRRRRSRSAS